MIKWSDPALGTPHLCYWDTLGHTSISKLPHVVQILMTLLPNILEVQTST